MSAQEQAFLVLTPKPDKQSWHGSTGMALQSRLYRHGAAGQASLHRHGSTETAPQARLYRCGPAGTRKETDSNRLAQAHKPPSPV